MGRLRIMVDLRKGLKLTYPGVVGLDGIWDNFAPWDPDLLIEVTEKKGVGWGEER